MANETQTQSANSARQSQTHKVDVNPERGIGRTASGTFIQLPEGLSTADQYKFLMNLAKETRKAGNASFDASTVELVVGKAGGVNYKGARRDLFPVSVIKAFNPILEARIIRFMLDNKDKISPSYSQDGVVTPDANSPSWTAFQEWADKVLPAMDLAAAYSEGGYEAVVEHCQACLAASTEGATE